MHHGLFPAGKTTPYDYLPFFYSRVFNLSWQFWGFNEAQQVAHFGDFEAGKFGAFWVKDGKVRQREGRSLVPSGSKTARRGKGG